MRPWQRDLAAAVVTTGLVIGLIVHAGGIWEHVGGDDLHGHLLPRYVATARAIVHEQRLPLWNPYEYCGAPLLGEAQGLSFYPPALLLFASLSPYWALQGLYAFNVFVLSWGCVAYLRAHGLPRCAGGFAALVTVAGVFNTPSLAGIDHPHYLAGVAWVPWILLCWQRATEVGIRPWLGLLGLTLAAQWFTGYPVFSMDSAVLLGVVALLSGGAPLIRRLAVLASGLALGAAVAAVQLLPLADAVAESVRTVSEHQFVLTRAILGLGQTGMWRHQIFGDYGPGAGVLALVALAAARPTRTRLAWAGATVWAAFALDPPLNLLYSLPPFSGVRYALGWIHLLPLFTGFLAAAGAALLVESRHVPVRILAGLLLVSAVVRAGGTVRAAPTRPTLAAPDYALLAQRAAILERALGRFAEQPRIFGNREMHGGTFLREHLRSGVGYNPSMPPAGPLQLMDAVNEGIDIPGGTLLLHRNHRVARLLGIGLAAVPDFRERFFRRAGFQLLGALPPDEILVYQEPVPRVRLVDQVIVEPDAAAALHRTLDPGRDLVKTAVVRAADAALLAPMSAGPRGRGVARVVEDAPERVVVEARAAAPALLVLGDTYDPGWVATVDGRAVPVLRTDHTFRGVVVPTGAHRIEFVYAPRGLRLGAAISVVALAVIGGFVGPWRRRRGAGA